MLWNYLLRTTCNSTLRRKPIDCVLHTCAWGGYIVYDILGLWVMKTQVLRDTTYIIAIKMNRCSATEIPKSPINP